MFIAKLSKSPFIRILLKHWGHLKFATVKQCTYYPQNVSVDY